MLVGRDAITRTDKDGAFKLAMLPGKCSLRAYGPTPDFEPVFETLPGTKSTAIFAHNISHIEVPQSGEVAPVTVAIRKAQPISGMVEHPATNTANTFLLASGRVSPVRGYATLPLEVRDGTFTVPSCRAGYTTRVYFLDPVGRFGAIADVTPGITPPPVNLLPCGTLHLRVLDREGKPRIGQKVAVSLLVARDRPAQSVHEELVEDSQPVEWFDAINYPAAPKTDADGRLELPV